MKFEARKHDGSVLISVSDDEYRSLVRLQQAVEGKTIADLSCFQQCDLSAENDFTGVFGAIRAFVLTKFYVNALSHHVKAMNDCLEDKL